VRIAVDVVRCRPASSIYRGASFPQWVSQSEVARYDNRTRETDIGIKRPSQLRPNDDSSHTFGLPPGKALTAPDSPRIALVTGGTRGIGTEIARGLVREGIIVHLTGRDGEKAVGVAAELARETGGAVTGHELEVTDGEAAQILVDEIRAQHGRIDVLVNNAAVELDLEGSALKADLDGVRIMLETNLIAPWRLIQLVAPGMLDHGYGRIVNVTTGLAQFERMADRRRDDHYPGHAGYRISKAALNALTALVAGELRDSSVLVNASDPGYCRTEMGAPFAPFSASEGAEVTIHLATIDENGPTAGWFFQRLPKTW